MRHRVVVTGLGVITPIGNDVASFGEALFAGQSGAGPVTLFDAASLRTRICAEVKLPPEVFTFRDRKLVFAELAAAQAMADGPPGERPGAEGGLSLGVGLELFSLEDMLARRRSDYRLPATRSARLTFLQTPSDLVVHHLSHRHGLHQVPLIHVSACAAGADAIGTAFHLVAHGLRRWMLAGGADSMINPLGLGGFCKIRATTTRNDAPARASRPFDAQRDGFLLGEGAGFLCLERLDDALSRGARIRAELVGYGRSLDAHGISEPHPEGRGALQAMQRALHDAGLTPEAVDAVNAHGTSTPKNDRVETLALRRLLGTRAGAVPISATKSMIGHLIAAAGAVEAVATVLGLEAQRVHPTVNLEEPDPDCDLDFVPGTARPWPQQYALSNSFGFGGHNASLVFRRFERSAP